MLQPRQIPKKTTLAAGGSDGSSKAPRGGGDVIELRPTAEGPPRVIAVTSGKGGVGKSFISANLGVALAATGRKVLLVDADLGLANLDLMLGVSARASLREVLSSNTRVIDALVSGPKGVSLLAACSGDYDMAEMDELQRRNIFTSIDALEDRFDTVIIDTGAGIGSNAIGFAAAAQQVLVVVTPDPASMADAYAMIKVMNQRHGVGRFHLVINQASGPKEADEIVNRLLGLTGRFLEVSVVPIGYIYRDDLVRKSVTECTPLVSSYPKSATAASLQALGRRVLDEDPGDASWGGPRLFWKRIIGLSGEDQG